MKLVTILTGVLAIAACGDDTVDSPIPDAALDRDFRLRIENVAPWNVLKVSTQRANTARVEGPLAPGKTYEIHVSAGDHQAFSFATMLAESNDWFFAPGPDGIPLYQDGAPISGDVTHYVRLWDAGTELDQEPGVGDATGRLQPARNTGDADPNPRVREVGTDVRLSDGTNFHRPAVADMIKVTVTPGAYDFTIRIVNVSRQTTLVTSQGTMAIHVSPVTWVLHRNAAPLFTPGEPVRENGLEDLVENGQPDQLAQALSYGRGFATPLSPGVFVVHTDAAPLFTLGEPDRERGLERLAEDGDPGPLADALAGAPGVVELGVFDTPVDAGEARAARPGEAFEAVLHGEPGEALSFATMFAMSDDWIFATAPEGIALFDGDIPRSCDVTAEVKLYDVGTELDEELDIGADTGTQQLAPDTGRDDPHPEVRAVTIDRYGEPAVLHIRVLLTPLAPDRPQ